MNWTVNANLRHITSEYYNIGDMLEKYNEKGRTNQSLIRYYDGASPTALYAVRSAGIDPMTGNEIFIRKDGSYTFKWDSADEVICGDSTPDIEGAFGSLLLERILYQCYIQLSLWRTSILVYPVQQSRKYQRRSSKIQSGQTSTLRQMAETG